MKQVKIGLTGKQRSELDRAAKAAGRTLSDEIRRRLANSLAQDRLSGFAQVVGDEAMWLAQIVFHTALGQRLQLVPDNGQGDVLDQGQNFDLNDAKENFGPELRRALVVALNDWFGEIKFGERLEVDSKADTIGRAAAQSFFVMQSELHRVRAEQETDNSEDEE
ncbi:hypothetical protein AB7G19_17075 [Bradyrhizobium sp. 215_C5_N1_1]|uniref:hypothetical protein n=1 Tax=unclassified Bradyrhizobium TaxID=2631580 RepID=UPI003F8BE188